MRNNFCKVTQLVNREVPPLDATFPQAPKAMGPVRFIGISCLCHFSLLIIPRCFKWKTLWGTSVYCLLEWEGGESRQFANDQKIDLMFKILLRFIFQFRVFSISGPGIQGPEHLHPSSHCQGLPPDWKLGYGGYSALIFLGEAGRKGRAEEKDWALTRCWLFPLPSFQRQ